MEELQQDLAVHPQRGLTEVLSETYRMKITSPAGSIVVELKLWEGVRPGTVAKCYQNLPS